MEVFRPFLKPPSTVASVPVLGTITMRSLATIGIATLLVVGITSLIGLPFLLSMLFGLIIGLVFDRAVYNGEPLAPIVTATITYWIKRGVNSSSVVVRFSTINEQYGHSDQSQFAIFDADGNVLVYQERG